MLEFLALSCPFEPRLHLYFLIEVLALWLSLFLSVSCVVVSLVASEVSLSTL
jgi:hypothetical protein